MGHYENVGAFLRNCSEKTLHYDEACLQVFTDKEVTFWSQREDCEDCMLLKTATLTQSKALVLTTLSTLNYAVRDGSGVICNGSYLFGEYGQYTINLSEVSKKECPPKMIAEPDAAMLPILTAVIILLSMATLWYVIKGIGKRIMAGRLYARYFVQEDNELGSETRVLTETARGPVRSRLRSLDIFRGFTIALMIFVNAGGGGYAIFSHAAWSGLTVADVVFPWLAFAMGEALVLSLNARLRTAITRLSAFGQVCRRALLLSLMGIVLGSVDKSWSTVRLPGVLQRLAAAYFIVASLECVFMRTSQNITPGRSLLRDIAAGWQQWIATLILVAIQVCVTLLVPAPGCPVGYEGPGGLHRTALGDFSLQNCTGGIAGYIDRKVFGESHLHQHGTFSDLYKSSVPHDPEGLLGVLTAALVVQCGAHATRIMLAYNHARARIMRWVLWSVLTGVAGGALCQFSSGGPLPVIKNLWSLPYCLVTSSMAFFIQATLYFFVDLKTKWGGRPFYYAGQNALFLYVSSELLKRHFPLRVSLPAPAHAPLLAAHAAAALLWLAVAAAMHRARVFITL